MHSAPVTFHSCCKRVVGMQAPSSWWIAEYRKNVILTCKKGPNLDTHSRVASRRCFGVLLTDHARVQPVVTALVRAAQSLN